MAIFDLQRKKGMDGTLLLILLALFSLFILGSTCYAIYDNYHPIPSWDQWIGVNLFRAYLEGNLDFRIFWQQHNDHRILFPKLFYLLDYLLAGGTGHLLLALIFSFQGLHALVLCRSLWKQQSLVGTEQALFSGVALVISFWLIQKENFIWPFQLAFILNGLAASLAAFLVCRIDPTREGFSRWGNTAAAAICCLVAAYSLANGILMWGVLLVVIWKAKLPRGLLFAWGFFGFALVFSYVVHYHSRYWHASPLDVFPLRTLHYFLVYLGNPFYRLPINHPYVLMLGSAFLGVLGLALFLFFARRYLREESPSFYGAFGFALTAYVVLTAGLTAMGRITFGVEQAASGRYHTPVLLFWFTLLILAYIHVSSQETLARWFRIGILLFLFLIVLPTQLLSGRALKLRYVTSDEASLALMAGVRDSAVLHAVFPRDFFILEGLDFLLRSHRLSFYRDPWTHMLGRNLREQYDVGSAPGLWGDVEEMRTFDMPPHSGYFVRGKLRPVGRAGKPDVILFAREDTVVGFAKTRKRPCQGCFSGYVRGLENRRFEMFGLDNESRRVSKIAFDAKP